MSGIGIFTGPAFAENFETLTDYLLPTVRAESMFTLHGDSCESLFAKTIDNELLGEELLSDVCNYVTEKHDGWNAKAMGHVLHMHDHANHGAAKEFHENTLFSSEHARAFRNKDSYFAKMVGDMD